MTSEKCLDVLNKIIDENDFEEIEAIEHVKKLIKRAKKTKRWKRKYLELQKAYIQYKNDTIRGYIDNPY